MDATPAVGVVKDHHKYTPEMINNPGELPEDSVFVFGSNTDGKHVSGSAKTAIDEFGAIEGQAEGRQGDSYGIVTTDFHKLDGPYPLEDIDAGIKTFCTYASQHPGEIFYMTKIGSMRAGHKLEDIVALFKNNTIPPNVILPQEFDAR